MAITLIVTSAFLLPLHASASKLEQWNLKNLPAETGDKVFEKKVAASDFTHLESTIEKCEFNEKDTVKCIDEFWLRDRMLTSFLQQRPVIGLKRDEVYKLMEDCSPLPLGTLRPANTRIFQIFDGTKVTKGDKRQPSICLEVLFAKDIAYAFRINLHTIEKPKNADFSKVFNSPRSTKSLWFWKFFIDWMLPMVLSQEAQKAGITEAPVMRKCDVVFNVSRDGTISDVRVKHSSYNPQFDSVVVDTIKRLSGKPSFRLPAEAESDTIEFNTSVELLVKEFGKKPLKPKSSRGKDSEQ